MALDHVEDAIAEVLEDVAVLIVNGHTRPTRSIAAYVVKALRMRLALQAKAEKSRSDIEYSAAEEVGGVGERAVASVVSESTLRSSRGPDWAPLPPSAALTKLASMIDEGLSDEERRILGWLSNFVAQRDICEWLGVSYSAGTQRIWRLRDRLRATAMEHAHHFTVPERAELHNFFGRMNESASGQRRDRRPPPPEARGGTS